MGGLVSLFRVAAHDGWPEVTSGADLRACSTDNATYNVPLGLLTTGTPALGECMALVGSAQQVALVRC